MEEFGALHGGDLCLGRALRGSAKKDQFVLEEREHEQHQQVNAENFPGDAPHAVEASAALGNCSGG